MFVEYRRSIIALFVVVWAGTISAGPAFGQGGSEAPSDYVESIETPTDVSADVMNESDAIEAEADAIAARIEALARGED